MAGVRKKLTPSRVSYSSNLCRELLIFYTARVVALESKYGWTITGVSGTTTSMTYRGEIELVFDAASFAYNVHKSKATTVENSRVDLWYIAANKEHCPSPLTPEKDFLLQNIRDHVRSMPQAQTTIKDLLNSVSVAWTRANVIFDDIRLINLTCPTETAKTADDTMVVQSSLLLRPLATKVRISFHLRAVSDQTGVDIRVIPDVHVVYGERFNESKMRDLLASRIQGNEKEDTGHGRWSDAVIELSQKLLARGRK